jgi:hypothetical protein
VHEFAVVRNTPRELLRLNSRDLAGLLDFKSLERLRDGYIHELKDLCHSVFRGQDQTDLLDRYVSDIFHQISILKEAHYNVKTYAPFFESSAREQELRGILDEAHEGFPKLTKHIHFLFQQAQNRMEQHLGSFRVIPIFIRSLFVHRDDFVARVYPSGIRQFYRFMYTLGAVEGFYRVGLSFYHAGFSDQARVAFEEALAACGDQIRTGDLRPGTERRRALEHLLDPLLMKLRRLGSKAVGVGRPCAFAGPVAVAPLALQEGRKGEAPTGRVDPSALGIAAGPG